MILVLLTAILYPLFALLAASRRRESLSRILVIQTAKIGDLVCTTPLFSAIKQKYPQSEVHALVNPVALPIIRYNQFVDQCIAHSSTDLRGIGGKKMLARLMMNGRYDTVISCNTNISFVLASVWAAVPRRLGVISEFSGLTYRIAAGMLTACTLHRQGRMLLETYGEMLKSLDIPVNPGEKAVFASPHADEKVGRFLASAGVLQDDILVGIAVSAGNRMKEIGSETLARVTDLLGEKPHSRFLLIGAEQDKDAARRIVESSRHADRILDATGRFELAELPPLLSRCRIFIGADTGIAYIADSLRVPIVLVPGPADMEDQRPTGERSVFLKSPLACVPCSHAFRAPYSCQRKDRACIISITPEAIAHAAEALLGNEPAG